MCLHCAKIEILNRIWLKLAQHYVHFIRNNLRFALTSTRKTPPSRTGKGTRITIVTTSSSAANKKKKNNKKKWKDTVIHNAVAVAANVAVAAKVKFAAWGCHKYGERQRACECVGLCVQERANKIRKPKRSRKWKKTMRAEAKKGSDGSSSSGGSDGHLAHQ